MEPKRFRSSLYFFYTVVCVAILNSQMSFAGTWTDAFEDNNTQEWEIFNAIDDLEKWWIDAGEAVGETFEPHHLPTTWATGELTWRNYSLSCKAKLVKAKKEPATLGLILHHKSEEILLLCISDSLPMGDRPHYKVYRQSINTRRVRFRSETQ